MDPILNGARSSMAFVRPSPSAIAMASRWREQPANFGGYCAVKFPRGIDSLPRMVSQDLLMPAMGGVLMKRDHVQFPIGLDAVVMVDSL